MRKITSLFVAVTVLAACDLSTEVQPPPIEWTGVFTGAHGWDIQGEAAMLWSENSHFVLAGATIAGDVPGAERPWRVHSDGCIESGPVLGSVDAYPPLQVNANGDAEAVAEVLATPDPNAQYHVNLYLSLDEMDTVIACADLFRESPF
jgi:hypothetical protein